MRATAMVPCSCGELVQGYIDGTYSLITCPVNIRAAVTVELKPGKGICGTPGRQKALKAVRLALELMGEKAGAGVTVKNPLPSGKGLATSTADIVAAAAATAGAAGHCFTPVELAKIALQIEPSDGTFFDGIVLFDHLKGMKQEYLGKALELEIMIVDLGGMTDTISFNRRKDLVALNKDKEPHVRKAAAMVKTGLAEKNASMVAKGATESALANQDILFKPELETVLDVALNSGALGVNTAHSGTVLGILYRAGNVDPAELRVKLLERFSFLKFYDASMADGGVEVVTAWSEENLQATAGK